MGGSAECGKCRPPPHFASFGESVRRSPNRPLNSCTRDSCVPRPSCKGPSRESRTRRPSQLIQWPMAFQASTSTNGYHDCTTGPTCSKVPQPWCGKPQVLPTSVSRKPSVCGHHAGTRQQVNRLGARCPRMVRPLPSRPSHQVGRMWDGGRCPSLLDRDAIAKHRSCITHRGIAVVSIRINGEAIRARSTLARRTPVVPLPIFQC